MFGLIARIAATASFVFAICFLHRQRGIIKNDLIEACLRRFLRLIERVRVIRVQKYRVVVLLAQAFDERSRLAHADKFALAFRHADQHRQLQFARGGKNRLQRRKVGDVEMADSNVAGFGIG
jgi:hypothetical protein